MDLAAQKRDTIGGCTLIIVALVPVALKERRLEAEIEEAA